MAFRIDYLRTGEKVMSVVCPKSLADCKADALQGLVKFNADKAVILNMDAYGQEVAVVTR